MPENHTSETGEEKVVRTVCASHCGGTCQMKVHVKDGKITRIESDDESENAHRMCFRGRAYRQRVYAPDRLLHPVKRIGPRGSREFTRISWDEALDTIADKLKMVKETYGNAAILHFCSMCDPHVLHHVNSFHRLLCLFGGYTAPWGTISNEGDNFASAMTTGGRPTTHEGGSQAQAYLNAKLIIMWSFNPVTTLQGTTVSRSLIQAKEAGAKFYSVDPRYTDSAAAFDAKWIPIRPCTDAAVFLAMANVIIKENLHDQEYIDAYTFGYDSYKDHVLGVDDGIEKTPEWAAEISGIPADNIADLARAYATTEGAYLATNLAAGRTAFGEQYHRAALSIQAITGNIPIPKGGAGGGASQFQELIRMSRLGTPERPKNPVEADMPLRWNKLPYRGPSVNSSARVNVNLFSDALLKGKAGGYAADYKFLWLSNTNYLNQLGEANKAVEAFNEAEFVLVTEQFMTATAQYADIVLPVCTFLERNDLRTGFGSGAIEFLGKAIEPLGESKSQLDICSELALKLGITDYNDKTDEEWLRHIHALWSEKVDMPDYDTLLARGGMYFPPVDYSASEPAKTPEPEEKERKLFPTPSGKIELFSQLVDGMNHPKIPPVPTYIETWESLNDPLAEKYPLQLTTPHFKRRAHSQFDNLPWLQELQTQLVSINPVDAEPRNIKEGDMVKVFNDSGKMLIPANITERIMPGVVAVPQGAWFDLDENGVDRGGCSNTLTRNVTSPAGAFSPNTALVQIEKGKG